MKSLVCLLLLAWSLLAPARAPAQPENRNIASGQLGSRLVEVAKRAEDRGFSGTFLAAKGGEVMAAAGIGFADEAGTVPNTPATLFEIASLTKQFTAAAVMRLVQDGKLSLDDPIAKHLPGVPEDCGAITVEHLLRHTSGIPGSNAEGFGEDLAIVLPQFLRGGPANAPGTNFEYWNQGYALLSEVIHRRSGQDYTTYCRSALFAPAGLTFTCFTGDEAPAACVVATGRSARGPSRSALEHPYGSYGFQYRGMGGVVTSVWDLWRWDRALRGDKVLTETSKTALFEPGLGDYALGWRVTRDSAGRLVQSHGGGVRGFVCEMRRYPEQDAMLVVLCNRDDAPLWDVVRDLESVLFGGPDEGANLRTLDALTAEAVRGRYKDSQGRVLVVTVEGAAAKAEIHWSPQGPVTRATLHSKADGTVILDDGAERLPVTLERDGDGAAKAFTVVGITFQRE